MTNRAMHEMASEAQMFVEVNPFHEITLFYLHATLSKRVDDLVLVHPRLLSRPLCSRIPATKEPLTFLRFISILRAGRIRWCHFNTIGFTLTPVTREISQLNMLALILPLIAKVLGCRMTGIVHEADQFFATEFDSCRKHAWFRRVFGRWFVRMFDHVYVLSQEVHEVLTSRGADVQLLDAHALSAFPSLAPQRATERQPGETLLCWIGPIESHRRNAELLLELDRSVLAKLNVSVVMVCDSRFGEGPQFKERVETLGLRDHFIFLDHRPDDDELFEWVRRSGGILCLYGGVDYGRTKTSGARIIAAAFSKPFLTTRPSLGLYTSDGALIVSTTLTGCVQELHRRLHERRSSDAGGDFVTSQAVSGTDRSRD